MYLLDTNVVSELRRPDRAGAALQTWVRSIPPFQLYLSAISILELEIGMLRIERRDLRQGQMLKAWLVTQVLPSFAGRILAVDTAVALRAATLHVPDPKPDRDAFIAATALVHGLTVVTRNIGDFAPTGVPLLNP
ncbi:MAG: type II toxin-antitoxin system VapC family toxin [Alphaproteobacteria bacterium]